MTRWERSNAPVRRSSAIARSTRCCTLAPASSPTNTRMGSAMGSAPVTKRTSSPVEAVPTYRAPSRPTPRGSTRDPGPVDTRGLAGGSRKPGSRSRAAFAVLVRKRLRATTDPATRPATATPAPMPTPTLDARARLLSAAETDRARRSADHPTSGGPRTVVAPSPARATGNNVRTRLGHSIKEGPMMRTCAY